MDTKYKFGKILSNVKHSIKDDFEIKDSNIKTMLINISVLFLFSLLSIFSKYFLIPALLFLSLIVIFSGNCKGLYYIVFSIPLINIFYFNGYSFNLLAIVIIEYLIVTYFTFIRDIVNKKIKPEITKSVVLAIFIALCFINLSRQNLFQTVGILSGLFIVNVVSYYSQHLDFKGLALMFAFGTLAAITIGLFRPFSSRLISFVPQYYAYGIKRFAGVSNPNFLAGTMIFSLSLLYLLKLDEKINLLFYPFYFIFFVTLIFTISKSGLINFICTTLLFLIIYLCKKFTLKKLLKVCGVVIVTLVIFFSLGFITRVYVNRFLSAIHVSEKFNNDIELVLPEKKEEQTSNGQVVMDELTTGRFSLWKNYLRKIFKNSKTAFWGYGIGAADTEDNGAGFITSSHNTFIQILYYKGIIGAISLIVFLVLCIGLKNLKKFKFKYFVPLLALALYMFCDNIFNYSLFCYLAIVIIGIKNEKEEKSDINVDIPVKEEKMMKKKINILLFNYGLGKGGTESYFVNLSKFIDKDRFNISVLIKSGKGIDQNFYDEFKKNCDEVYICGNETSTKKEEFKNLKKFFKKHKNQFDIIHINSASGKECLVGLMAKFYGRIKNIIFHSHMGGSDSKVSKFNGLYKIILNKLACRKFACSTEAAQFVFGKSNDVILLNNSVDLEKFSFNEDVRLNKRKELDIKENDFVLLNVGRFVEQKNHKYLIKIFCELQKQDKQAKLILIGNGEQEDCIKELVKENDIPNVYFLEKRKDISEIMQASDVMVMPSLHEGLPIVCVEAQATGLPIVISDNVSKESNVGGLCEYLSLKTNVDDWVKIILSYKNRKRQNVQDKIIKNGFDNKSAIKKLENYYYEIINNSKKIKENL